MASDAASRVALITGGAGGIGLAIARRLMQSGFLPLICDVDENRLLAAVGQLREDNARAAGFITDIVDEQSVAALFDQIKRQYGALHVLVNNAGVNAPKRPVADIEIATWRRVIDVNLTGPLLMSRAAIPLLSANGWGRIINMSSRAARTLTSLNNSPYTASKAGLMALSRSLAGELGPSGVTVNCIAPSRVDTELSRAANGGGDVLKQSRETSPLGRAATTGDVAGVVNFLCSEDANYVTGTVIDVNGGTFMP